jgi:hypothetical protein
MLIVSLVALVVAAAAVVPGCGGGGAPEVTVEGLFRVWAPQLLPAAGGPGMMSAQQLNPDEPIALADTFIEFFSNGECHMEGHVADQTDLAQVSPQHAWNSSFSMDGTWTQEDNIVYASLSGLGDAQVSPSQFADFAEITLEFKSDTEADGEILLLLDFGGMPIELELKSYTEAEGETAFLEVTGMTPEEWRNSDSKTEDEALFLELLSFVVPEQLGILMPPAESAWEGALAIQREFRD